MKKRLNRIALLTSPIIAIYGVAPVFLLKSVEIVPIVIAFCAYSTLLEAKHRINTKLKSSSRYAISYFTTFILQSAILLVIPKFPDQQSPADFLLYSFASTLAINTIILVIIDLERRRGSKTKIG